MEQRYGMSGTQDGMTDAQREHFTSILQLLYQRAREAGAEIWLHHGDCIGSDTQAHMIADSIGFNIAIHPGFSKRSGAPDKRAYCGRMLGCRHKLTEAEPLPYLERNRVIVDRTKGLIATPNTMVPSFSGTWSTVKYAQEVRRPHMVILPDGSCRKVKYE